MKKRLFCLLLALILALTVPAAAEEAPKTLSNGSTVTTVTHPDTGHTTTTVTDTDGNVTVLTANKRGRLLDVQLHISLDAARRSAAGMETITMPLESPVKPSEDQNLIFSVDLPFGVGPVYVEFPLTEGLPGAVAVTVDEEGNETLLPHCWLWDDSLVVPLERDSLVKLVDNSRAFADVHEAGHWARDGVDFTVARGLFKGVDDTLFDPDGTITRGQLVTVLWRTVGAPRVDHAMTFVDVSPGSYYLDAVGWAFAQKLVSGYDARTFAPNAPITREQLTAILWRFAEMPAGGEALAFADAGSAAPYAREALEWAVDQDILEVRDGLLRPGDPASRGLCAQMLMHYLCR